MEFAKFFPIWGNLALAAKVQVGGIWAPNDDKILLSDRFTPGGTAYDGVIRGYDDGSLTPDTILTDIDSVYFYSQEPPSSGNPDITQADSLKIDTSLYDTRVRGNYMFVTNWELQFPLLPQQLYLLAFFDAGNSWLTWEDFTDFNSWKVYKSVGFGFRLAVPGIGTIGFDFGYPLDSRVENLVTGELAPKKWKPHFQIGTTFR
jgi:outer membrane protein assembly factor BamA